MYDRVCTTKVQVRNLKAFTSSSPVGGQYLREAASKGKAEVPSERLPQLEHCEGKLASRCSILSPMIADFIKSSPTSARRRPSAPECETRRFGCSKREGRRLKVQKGKDEVFCCYSLAKTRHRREFCDEREQRRAAAISAKSTTREEARRTSHSMLRISLVKEIRSPSTFVPAPLKPPQRQPQEARDPACKWGKEVS